MERTRAREQETYHEHMALSGAHICQIYTSETERRHAVRDFIGSGLRLGERTYCINDAPADAGLEAFLDAQGLSLSRAEQAGSFIPENSREFYLKDGSFDHERIYRQWAEIYADALARGYPGMRAIAELRPEMEQLGGGNAIILYETKINAVFQATPPTRVVCQYDARSFSGWTIMGVLKAHPLLLVDRKVCANPYFTPEHRMSSH
jgi:hypothetical protein